VELHSLDRAVLLLDEWIAHARALEADNARLRAKYAAAHERCEQLRAIVAETDF
jgi:hypothetical protein